MDNTVLAKKTLYKDLPAGYPTVLLVAENESVRNALRAWLELSFPCCRFLEAATLEEALVLAVDLAPRAAVILLGRTAHSNVKTIRALKAAMPRLHIITVSEHETPEYRTEARGAGASAFVATRYLGSDLIPTVGHFLDQAETT